MEKKRHHYIPITYLDAFTASDGMLYAYRKDNPTRALRSRPSEIGFERYYYSQPLPNEGQDNNRLEDLFSKVEAPWPEIVSRLKSGHTDKSLLAALFEFMALMRVRVPAARELVEVSLAERVKATAKLLDRTGQLPPKPEGLEDLLDHLTVSVDPHMSIHAMSDMMKGFGDILDSVGLRVVHNRTDVDFLTSDNPIIYFDPSVREDFLQPYRINPEQRQIELFFPLDPETVLVGHTLWRSQFLHSGVQTYELYDPQAVKRINRFIARFGYRFVFSATRSHERLIVKYSGQSPVGETTVIPNEQSNFIILRTVFGQRPKLHKWVRQPGQKFSGVDSDEKPMEDPK